MQIENFFIEFKTIAHNYEWKVYSDGTIRGKGDFHYFVPYACPITALVRVKFNKFFHMDQFLKAAQLLDLAEEDAKVLADAADYSNSVMRNRLLEVLEIKNG